MSDSVIDSIKTYSNFLHPIAMWALFFMTLYAGYLGIQSRRLRSVDKETRRAMAKKKFGDRHYKYGSILLAIMVIGNTEGMAVTYWNNGKLFVDDHLLAGIAMTTLIAVAASLVPPMRRGKDWARYSHIALSTIIVGLFGWQAVSGMEIMNKIMSQL
ncbi:MAG: DUF4079 domain-containing protein [Cyanobacteria bacterium P01_C01_bin.89]